MRPTSTTPLLALLTCLLVGAGTAAAVVVERIEVEGADVVRFHLSESSVARAIGLPARLPVQSRIAVDFGGATLGPGARQPVPGADPIIRVRPEEVQGGDMVRAMIELTRPVGFTVESAGTVVTVRLQVAAPAPPPAAPDVEQPVVPPAP